MYIEYMYISWHSGQTMIFPKKMDYMSDGSVIKRQTQV